MAFVTTDDSRNDGGDKKRRAGAWFTPIVGERYYVPEDAGNYMNLRGRHGKCIGVKTTTHGHSYALIRFDASGKPRKSKTEKLVRTMYLLAEDESTKMAPVDDIERIECDKTDAPHPLIKRRVQASILGGNTGTVELKGF